MSALLISLGRHGDIGDVYRGVNSLLRPRVNLTNKVNKAYWQGELRIWGDNKLNFPGLVDTSSAPNEIRGRR